MNPHPPNCVCFQANCTSSLLNRPAAGAGDTNQKVPAASGSSNVVQSRKVCDFIEKNKQLCRIPKRRQLASHLSKESDESEDDDESKENDDCNSEKSETNSNETVIDIAKENLPSQTDNSSLTDENLNKDLPAKTSCMDGNGNETEYITIKEKTELQYVFNPKNLCPHEIRTGIRQCITENNESLYFYTIPVYEKKHHSNNKEETEDNDYSACANDSKSEKEDINEKIVEQIEDANENQADEDNVSSVQMETMTFDPLNPYPEFDFQLNEVDTSLVRRLLKNVEPNLIWTWSKDSVSYKHLNKDQLVNRFPNTPFTTKVSISLFTLHKYKNYLPHIGTNSFVIITKNYMMYLLTARAVQHNAAAALV